MTMTMYSTALGNAAAAAISLADLEGQVWANGTSREETTVMSPPHSSRSSSPSDVPAS